MDLDAMRQKTRWTGDDRAESPCDMGWRDIEDMIAKIVRLKAEVQSKEAKIVVTLAEVCTLQQHVERLMPKKLDGPPTEPGWYWWCAYGGVVVKQVERRPSGVLVLAEAGCAVTSITGTWYGPIPDPPKEG